MVDGGNGAGRIGREWFLLAFSDIFTGVTATSLIRGGLWLRAQPVFIGTSSALIRRREPVQHRVPCDDDVTRRLSLTNCSCYDKHGSRTTCLTQGFCNDRPPHPHPALGGEETKSRLQRVRNARQRINAR